MADKNTLINQPSRLVAWSSTNCVQRYTKSPELPRNSGDFFDLFIMITLMMDGLARGKTLLYLCSGRFNELTDKLAH